MLTIDGLRRIIDTPHYPDDALVLVAAFMPDGVGTVHEVEEVARNNGHLQLMISLPAGRYKRRHRPENPDMERSTEPF